jgi:ribosomal protein S20
MPIIKSAIKAMKQNIKAKERNRVTKADFRAKVKVVRKDIATGSRDAEKLLATAIQAIDKAAKKGVIHKRAASRRKSRLMLAANKANGKPVVIKTIKTKSDKPVAKKATPTKTVAKKPVAAKTPTKKVTTTTTTKKTTKKEA